MRATKTSTEIELKTSREWDVFKCPINPTEGNQGGTKDQRREGTNSKQQDRRCKLLHSNNYLKGTRHSNRKSVLSDLIWKTFNNKD